jgi:hypothetical protein
VQRLRAPWTEWPPMRQLGERDEPETTAAVAAAIARELADLGIGLDFAPVVDVDTNPNNPVIGDRSFAREPARVARHAAAFITAMQAAGVAACAKHFPGHGDTTQRQPPRAAPTRARPGPPPRGRAPAVSRGDRRRRRQRDDGARAVPSPRPRAPGHARARRHGPAARRARLRRRGVQRRPRDEGGRRPLSAPSRWCAAASRRAATRCWCAASSTWCARCCGCSSTRRTGCSSSRCGGWSRSSSATRRRTGGRALGEAPPVVAKPGLIADLFAVPELLRTPEPVLEVPPYEEHQALSRQIRGER